MELKNDRGNEWDIKGGKDSRHKLGDYCDPVVNGKRIQLLTGTKKEPTWNQGQEGIKRRYKEAQAGIC